MDAFIPCGAPLSASRSFLNGRTPDAPNSLCSARSTSSKTDERRQTIVAIKIPELPKIPFLNKKTAPPPKPAPRKKATGLKINLAQNDGIETKSGRSGSLVDGLPKFYNPPTARHVFKSKAAGQGATPFDMRVGNHANQRVNENSTFRNMDPYTEPTVWARNDWSSDEAKVAVSVAIRNVFGNANLFESELAELADSISCVTKTADMREFVRALGLSEAYRKRFFESCSNQRFVELNFKHFLGRAPRTQTEISEHIQILVNEGYNAEINSYIDSSEYDSLWGKSRVPAVNFRGGHPYNNDMNKLAVLNGGFGTSDRLVKKAAITNGDASGYTGFGVYKGLPTAWRGENAARDEAGPVMRFSESKFWNSFMMSVQSDEIEWRSKWGPTFKYWYKNSLPYEESITPKLSSSREEELEAEAILKYGSLMGKFFVGSSKSRSFDLAPIIRLSAPVGGLGGFVSVAMAKVETPIPMELREENLPQSMVKAE